MATDERMGRNQSGLRTPLRPKHMKTDLLTVQEAAELVGVSTSTLKRWCDNESVPMHRTPGGHRRIDRVDLDRISHKILSPHIELGESSTRGLSIHIVQDLLMRGESLQLARLFRQSANDPLRLIALLEDYLVPALWSIGAQWRAGQIDVYEEHICSQTTLTMLDVLRQSVPPPRAGQRRGIGGVTAVGGSLEPCVETIASKLISVCLELMGRRVFDLGASIPPVSMARAARDHQSAFVWVTHTHVTDTETLLSKHLELRSLLPPTIRIVGGGGGLSPSMRRALPWCSFYETIKQFIVRELDCES